MSRRSSARMPIVKIGRKPLSFVLLFRCRRRPAPLNTAEFVELKRAIATLRIARRT
jgi:hypothetical protein